MTIIKDIKMIMMVNKLQEVLFADPESGIENIKLTFFLVNMVLKL